MTTNLINKLAEQMLEVAKVTVNKVHVCYYEKEIAARQALHALEAHPVFGIYTGDEIKKGLTAGQWQRLGEAIYTFIQEKQ